MGKRAVHARSRVVNEIRENSHRVVAAEYEYIIQLD